jgi:hypothetical protein
VVGQDPGSELGGRVIRGIVGMRTTSMLRPLLLCLTAVWAVGVEREMHEKM